MRHGMVNRKLGRTSAHRNALFRNQLASLIDRERIITTLPKAKELRPQIERLITLARTDTFGELDVRALLAAFQVPRLDHVGEGWGGGRTALYEAADGRSTSVVALSWDSVLDAAQWEEAVTTLVRLLTACC